MFNNTYNSEHKYFMLTLHLRKPYVKPVNMKSRKGFIIEAILYLCKHSLIKDYFCQAFSNTKDKLCVNKYDYC